MTRAFLFSAGQRVAHTPPERRLGVLDPLAELVPAVLDGLAKVEPAWFLEQGSFLADG